jgi:hypothetical protein
MLFIFLKKNIYSKMGNVIFCGIFVVTRNLSLLFWTIQGLCNNCIEVGIMLYY